jgi:hypothetical protein
MAIYNKGKSIIYQTKDEPMSPSMINTNTIPKLRPLTKDEVIEVSLF